MQGIFRILLDLLYVILLFVLFIFFLLQFLILTYQTIKRTRNVGCALVCLVTITLDITTKYIWTEPLQRLKQRVHA